MKTYNEETFDILIQLLDQAAFEAPNLQDDVNASIILTSGLVALKARKYLADQGQMDPTVEEIIKVIEEKILGLLDAFFEGLNGFEGVNFQMAQPEDFEVEEFPIADLDEKKTLH